ncbi:hypothetical protein DB347_04095 [Opitutaceae bacterium EW11]|nr:hypothetical protein DB347_04095 [Opitutaceae bacterium EW11]
MSKSRSQRLTAFALSAGASSVLFAVSAYAQDAASTKKDDEPQKLEKFEVTGSRIKRVDAESVSPVQAITFQDMQVQGFTTVGEAIRAMPFNSGQALTPTDSGTSFTPGVSTVNLRSLGNNSTLVLINGRRAVPYAVPGFNGFQTMFDLNSIPEAAIERVEILKDGGSALYGSDAVAGVVNFILRKDYQGLNVSTEIGNYFNTDGLMRKASAMVGAVSGKMSVSTSISYEKRNAVFSRDVPSAANVDKTSVGQQANPKYIIEGYQAAGFSSVDAYLKDAGLTDPVSDGYIGDNRSSRGYPGYVRVPGVGLRSFATPTDNPTTAAATRSPNYYNYNESNGLFPEMEKYAMYTRADFEFTPDLSAFAELSFNRTHSLVYSAATPADIETSWGLSPGVGMIIPAYNKYNPWGVDISNGRRRMVENGARISDVTSDTPRVLAGLKGNISALEGWTWESAVVYSKNDVNNLNRGTIPDYRMQQALMGLTRNGDGSLAWNPATPQNDRVYFNWFGWNEKAMADFLEVENPTSAFIKYTSYDFQTSGPIFQLPAGPLQLGLGGEHRNESFGKIQSDLNATGNILGGSEGTSSFGDRRVTSIFAELDVPILKGMRFVNSLEAQLAARYESYSDPGFAKRARPKIGVKYSPFTWLAFRASYAKSFKAPDLAYLFTSSQTTFSSYQATDPVTGSKIDQVQTVVAGNRNLHPELTDTWYGGVVFAPEGKLKGLELTLDYFHFQQKDLLVQLSDLYSYSEFFTGAATGNPLFAGKVVRDPATNEVLYIRDDYVNVARGEYRGADLGASYLWKTNNLGNLYVAANATWINETSVDGSNLVGSYLNARWNGTAQINWRKGDWAVNLFEVYRGKRQRSLLLGSWYDMGDSVYAHYTVKPQYTTNVSVTYRGFRGIEVTVGVNNVFDAKGPVDPMDGTGTTAGINTVEPAFWHVRLEKQF